MADYSPDDSAYATRIVERLINREAEGLNLEPDIVVSDVESDANVFSDELSLLEELNSNFPAVPIAGETVPVLSRLPWANQLTDGRSSRLESAGLALGGNIRFSTRLCTTISARS